MKRAFGYTRVSGKGQVKGHGPERQRDDIQTFADANGYRIVRYFEDSHSGTEADRPAFVELLEALMADGIKTVIVESLDRLARDVMIQSQLLAKLASSGFTLIAANTGEDVTAAMEEDPMRKAMVQIQGVFAELDKSLTVRKLRKAREKLRKNGKCEGRKAFGEKEGESETVQRVLKLRDAGMSFAAIAAKLNEEQVATRTGSKWHDSTVRNIVQRG